MYIPDEEYKYILKNMPILCVDLLIMHDGRCLLLKRDNEPAKGEYWFAGGRVRKLETIESAAKRIAKEETNLNCTFIKIISVEETIFPKNNDMLTDIHTVNLCCHLAPDGITELNLDKHHNGYKWIKKQNPNFHSAVNHPLSLLGF